MQIVTFPFEMAWNSSNISVNDDVISSFFLPFSSISFDPSPFLQDVIWFFPLSPLGFGVPVVGSRGQIVQSSGAPVRQPDAPGRRHRDGERVYPRVAPPRGEGAQSRGSGQDAGRWGLAGNGQVIVLIKIIFLMFLADTYTCPILGPLVPLFWISSAISSGLQSQSGFCLICALEENVKYILWHPPLVLQKNKNKITELAHMTNIININVWALT